MQLWRFEGESPRKKSHLLPLVCPFWWKIQVLALHSGQCAFNLRIRLKGFNWTSCIFFLQQKFLCMQLTFRLLYDFIFSKFEATTFSEEQLNLKLFTTSFIPISICLVYSRKPGYLPTRYFKLFFGYILTIFDIFEILLR